MSYCIQERHQITVSTDPQPRCYNGCHFSSEQVWTPWENFDYVATPEKGAERIKFWTELNDYAINQRGASAKREFKLVPLKEDL